MKRLFLPIGLVLVSSFFYFSFPARADLAPDLVVRLTPDSWEGPPNNSVTFEAKAYRYEVQPGAEKGSSDEIEVTSQTSFSWKTTFATLKPNGNQATLNTGSNGGTGEVTVTASYGGFTASDSSPFKVCIGARPTPDSPCNTTGSEPADEPTQTTTTTTTTTAPSTTSTKTRVKAQPTLQTGLPVPADQPIIEALAVSPSLSVDEVVNGIIVQADSSEKEGVIFIGTFLANTSVYVYIFSQSVSGQTQADSTGQWAFAIDQPLSPGQHIAYAVAKQSDGTYARSQPRSFEVAQNGKLAEQPSQMTETTSSFTITPLHVLAGLLTLAVPTAIVIFILRKRAQLKG